MQTSPTRRAAFKKWYKTHKSRFNEERRIRYQLDTEYRQTILARQQRTRSLSTQPGKGVAPKEKKYFRLGEVAEFVGASPQAIRKWEQAGFIPMPTRPGKHRYYTIQQMILLKDFVDVALMVRYRRDIRALAVGKKSAELYAMWS